MDKLTAGTKIYYTGDMANVSGFGEITKVASGWYPVEYTIVMEDGRQWKGVTPTNFDGAGRRFMTAVEYEAKRQESLERLRQYLNK